VRDLGAGITVGIVALPLALAFAIASGLKPEQGLITAIVAGFLISAWAARQVQIGGPAGAFIVIVYGIVERTAWPTCCSPPAAAGALMFLMGLFKLGAGALHPGEHRHRLHQRHRGADRAVAAADLLGLPIAKMPGDFFAQIGTVLAAPAPRSTRLGAAAHRRPAWRWWCCGPRLHHAAAAGWAAFARAHLPAPSSRWCWPPPR
jgi:sulfate permease, SulP family